SPKDIPQVSYDKIQKSNCVHQCNLLFFTHNHYKGKKWIVVLNIIDVSSWYKASVPLTLKKSSEIVKVFRKIYNSSSNPLTWPKLLTVDGSHKYMGEVFQIMQKH